jgi:hypothetical protein
MKPNAEVGLFTKPSTIYLFNLLTNQMKILDVLHREAILADLKALDKKGVLEELLWLVSPA